MKQLSRVSVAVIGMVSVAACSYVKSQFPDKERDYQFSTEIPPLTLPSDLQDNAINNQPIVGDSAVLNKNQQSQDGTRTERNFPPTLPAPNYVPVELVAFDGGATRLRIEEPASRAWRYVGKALTRHAIEIVSRNEEKHEYVVQYDPHAKKVEDGSLWDEVVFLFGDDPSQENEFRIKMEERNAKMTEAIVLDKNNHPLSQGTALQLLQLLKDTINKDLAKGAQ